MQLNWCVLKYLTATAPVWFQSVVTSQGWTRWDEHKPTQTSTKEFCSGKFRISSQRIITDFWQPRCLLHVSSPRIPLCVPGSCEVFNNLRVLSAASCFSCLFLPGVIICPSPITSSLFTSSSPFLLHFKTRSFSCCSWAEIIWICNRSTKCKQI